VKFTQPRTFLARLILRRFALVPNCPFVGQSGSPSPKPRGAQPCRRFPNEGPPAMTKARRITAVLLTTSFLAGLTLWQTYQADAQVIKRVAKPGFDDTEGNGPATSAITLPTERKAQQVMNAARQLVGEKEWGQALQSLLDTPNDGFVQVTREAAGPNGKASVQWVSMKAEANRLLGLMPVDGLQFYELQYGPPAKQRLADAKQRGDTTILAEVATR